MVDPALEDDVGSEVTSAEEVIEGGCGSSCSVDDECSRASEVILDEATTTLVVSCTAGGGCDVDDSGVLVAFVVLVLDFSASTDDDPD